jgi:GT2 family glycosyltransferase
VAGVVPLRTVPVSVVVPTIGRPALVQSLLESLARCDPRASEIVVVDQSHTEALARVVSKFNHIGTRLVLCEGRGEGRGRNVGLREAKHDLVLGTDDDCTVAEDWIGSAWKHVSSDRYGIVTGRVLAEGDPRAVPSTRDDPLPHDYTGDLSCFPLFPNNMALNREIALALGGFDEHLPSAPDNDFCYRWLRAGLRLRYEPDLVVWHHDWRTPEQLERLYVNYGRGQGAVYAKHLRKGDLAVLRLVSRDLYAGARGLASGYIRGRPRWTDPRQGLIRGLPIGLIRGWQAYRAGNEDFSALERLVEADVPGPVSSG